jgi:two-component system, chemotaxis family, sensor kinase CheA
MEWVPGANTMGEMDAIIAEFLIESRENLDQVECGLVDLEKDPDASETLASVFRSIHSIKGATGFLGFAKLGAVAHAGETLLSRLRDRSIVFNPAITSVFLALVDAIRQILTSIEKTTGEGDTDYTSLIERLAAPQAKGAPAASPDLPAIAEPVAARSVPVTDVAPLAPRAVPAPIAAPEPVDLSLITQSSGNIRVNVEQLDQLMNLVSELVLIRNELQQHTSRWEDAGLIGCSQRLTGITTQLQEAVMKTRMQPIDNVWNKFPRLVRDSALQCGKNVRLDMEGKDTELDKTLIEAIRDPLTHLLRNSIDHGFEGPEQRLQSGKAIEGRLSLRAFHEGGQVIIEVSDDGAGVDLLAVKRKALENGLITADHARDMSETEAMELIFLPGFSTAKQITSISGRGVGMDVVRTNIAKIGGKVTVSSEPGRGTTLKIRIPLTLAIMPALIVTACGDRYAIPQGNVLELVRLESDAQRTEIQMFREAAVYRLRGESLPLVRLDVSLGTQSQPVASGVDAHDSVVNIVVLQVDGRKFGLIVDGVDDTQEIVVKPLRNLLKGLSVFAGATIMGDGQPILILDVPGFAVHAHVLSELRELKGAPDQTPEIGAADQKHSLLLFAGEDEAQMAVPLSNVMRLEQFAPKAVERSEDRDVVQYMGEIMPLVHLSDLLPERRREPRHASIANGSDELIHVIVYSNGTRRVGLVVNRFLDTIEHALTNLRPASRRGTMGSLVILGRVTEILDVEAISAGLLKIAGPIGLPEEATV